MQIVEFAPGTLRFVDAIPQQAPASGFIWIFLEREELESVLDALQSAAQGIGGSALHELHCKDLSSEVHPSHYDYTSVYDLVIFRRLASAAEAQADTAAPGETHRGNRAKPLITRISTRAVGFAVFDRLLISVHPPGCFTARSFIQRYLADALQTESISASVTARSRLPSSPADLMLRMVNLMVDSYLDLRKVLTTQLERWQAELLDPRSSFNDWNALMGARSQLHSLEDLCEEQHDAMQEWLDTLREQAPTSATLPAAQAEHDSLLARSRDVVEHIQRVMHHARRLEQNAETVVQIHFSAQSNRTNEIMRTLTALTAVFLPLNLVTGVFGMNFEAMPLVREQGGFWLAMALMGVIAGTLLLVFRRRRYIARSSR